MTPLSPSAGRTLLDPRLTLLPAVAAVAVAVALVQRTPVAPLPHFTEDFPGGGTVGRALSAAPAWLAVRG